MTPVINGEPNRRALQAIALIEGCAPLEELKAHVEAGCPHVAYERSPSKPRSAYLTRHVLDACFKSELGVQSMKSDGVCASAMIGPVHESEGREPHFDYLLSKGFTPGSNGYRGGLFRHILRSCFYRENREQARKFARILAKHHPQEVRLFADHDYGWNSSVEDLGFLQSLGVELDTGAMLDNSLNYFGCDNCGDADPDGRYKVIRALLDRGAKPTKNLWGCVSREHIRVQLEKYGLIDELASYGVISRDDPEGYQAWKERNADYLAKQGILHPQEA